MVIDEILRRRLADDQYNAAIDDADEVLTLACAGSGKSRTLASRVARLVSEEPAHPDAIVAFTFTEKAAESMKRAIAEALEASGLDVRALGRMYVGTIHSFCKDLLGRMDARYRQFEVLDENRLRLYLLSRFYALGLQTLQASRGGGRQFITITQVANAWKTLNDEMLSLEDVTAQDPELGQVLTNIENGLARDHFIDFSLMVRVVADAMVRRDPGVERAVSGITQLLVDEYQDVNPAQERVIAELHSRGAKLFVVGDDDQAIYAWRGADVMNILEFRQRYPRCSVHTLSRNYRSTRAIVMAADSFIHGELGPTRFPKHPQAGDPPGPRDLRKVWFQSRAQEAEWVAQRIEHLLGTAYEDKDGVRGLTPADFAILMRSTKGEELDGTPRHLPFTRALAARGIRYTLEAGGTPFDVPQVAVLREAFELLRDGMPSQDQARGHFNARVLPIYPEANFRQYAEVLMEWGRNIHADTRGGARRRVYPQELVHELLHAFGLPRMSAPDDVMHAIGVFSKILQDVESVYLSVDSTGRFRQILNFLSNLGESGYDISSEYMLARPDAVAVSTVHKVKGLEFPVVFIVDMEAQRFPGNRQSYDGWLPRRVLGRALARNAYHGSREEEARLFYTALTRAERFLHITGCAQLPNGKRRRNPSPFFNALADAELSEDGDGLPADLREATPRRRVDETILPTTFSDIRYYLRCPADYRLRKIFDFSPPVPEMFGFGLTVHAGVGKLHEQFPDHPPTPEEAERVAREVFHLKHVPQSGNPSSPGPYERAKESAAGILRDYAQEYQEDFTRRRQVEARFELPARKTVISGAIDLLVDEDEEGRWLDAVVIDFKTMRGGDDPLMNDQLDWTELSLQVQLYAKAARDVLSQHAYAGKVHLLRDGQRIDVPIDDEAVDAAVQTVEWAVERIIASDFPMRPHESKCGDCDFVRLCPARPESFSSTTAPPDIHTPKGPLAVRAFREAA